MEQFQQTADRAGEKRATTRKPVHITAELMDRIKGLPSSVQVENLTEHGLYFVTSFSQAVGSVVEVRLTFPADVDHGARHVELLVRIVRIEKKGDDFGVAAQIMRCQTLPDRPSAGATWNSDSE